MATRTRIRRAVQRRTAHSADTWRTVARGLGIAGLGLGAAQVSAPRLLSRAIGVRPTDSARGCMRMVGVREILAGVGTLATRLPMIPMWSRVAGDLMDLGLLGSSLTNRRNSRGRVGGTVAAVAGILALDATTATRLLMKMRARQPRRLTTALTIRRPMDEVHRALREDVGLRLATAPQVRAAPGDRGTEVLVEVDDAKQLGHVRDELRRLKQRLEVGEVIRSDDSPEGSQATVHLRGRPAQPLPQEARR
jgi:hypothetical protein